MIDTFLQRIWYGRSVLALLLLPLAWLFVLIAAVRRWCYRTEIFAVARVAKPVIVVGNITVGGTGKTPFVIWLAEALSQRGYVVGVIVRGYGGAAADWPRDVDDACDPNAVGDEAVLLARNTKAIVVSGPDRVRAARRAIERGANLIISDDGLQHYRLARDFEIAVVDDARRFGNGFRLPAGPLREPLRRLRSVDAVIRNCRRASAGENKPIGHSFELQAFTTIQFARSLTTGETRPLHTFAGHAVHAIAAIGNPQAFFDALRAHGLQVDSRALADHLRLTAGDLNFDDDTPVLMTEKDAVKCGRFIDARMWAVPIEIKLDQPQRLLDAITRRLDSAR